MAKGYWELEQDVLKWAADKGIMEKGNPAAQSEKTKEEVEELIQAIKDNNPVEIKDALGDILVTIIIQAEMQGLHLEDCLETAYNVIAKRTGKMVDGQFLKDE
jgi:NTP pyrophosphatase (non-canonical NTP hydrolase)